MKKILFVLAISLGATTASAYTVITHANSTLDALSSRGTIQGTRSNGTPCYFTVTKYAYFDGKETDNQYLLQVSTVMTGQNTSNTVTAPTAFNENISTPDNVHMQVSVPENDNSIFLFTLSAQGQVQSFVATRHSDYDHSQTTIDCAIPTADLF